MTKDLVSIILPCYNAEQYIEKFLNSLMIQDYKNLELIVIDDGSTDNSCNIINNYTSQVDFNIVYVYQENLGLPSAINKGLQYVRGEFFTWSDPDDYLHSHSISSKVNFLKNDKNCEYGFVRTKVTFVDESGKYISDSYDCGVSNIFEKIIFEDGVPITPGNYLLRMKCFKSVVPSLTILDNVRGQNWQLLLPMAYKFKCGFIDESYNYYLVRSGSMSHSDKCLEDEMYRCNEHQTIIIKTISNFIKESKLKELVNAIERKYMLKKMYVAMKYNNKEIVNDLFKQIDKKSLKVYIHYFLFVTGSLGYLKSMKSFKKTTHD